MNFQKEVIERSKDIPILVDFWAPWCGPCRFIGPVLEELAQENVGNWELVKVNVDENQELSMQYQIRGIPAVKLFYNGEVIGEFGGAAPRNVIEKFLDDHLPNASKDFLAEILASEKSWPDAEFVENLENFLEENPGEEVARINLARHLLFSDMEQTKAIAQSFKIGDPQYDQANHIRKMIYFLDFQVKSESKLNLIIKEAQEKFISEDLEACIQLIIEANRLDKSFHHDLPRKTAIALFELMGKAHPLTKKYRRKFDMVLY